MPPHPVSRVGGFTTCAAPRRTSHRRERNCANIALFLPSHAICICIVSAGLTMHKLIGSAIREYSDLIAVAPARRIERGLSFEVLDALSGVQSGYSAKLLSQQPSKNFGPISVGAIFGALGLQLVATEDRAALARIQSRSTRRDERRVRTSSQSRSNARDTQKEFTRQRSQALVRRWSRSDKVPDRP